MRARLLAALALLCAASACGAEDRGPPVARPTFSPGAREIYEHERAGHVPASLVPGRWRAGGRVLVLGEVDEVILDGERVGSYTVYTDGFEFETDVRGCDRVRWSFDEGDLVLDARPRCVIEGRWRRAGRN